MNKEGYKGTYTYKMMPLDDKEGSPAVLWRKYHATTAPYKVEWLPVEKTVISESVMFNRIAEIPRLIQPDNFMVQLLFSHEKLREENKALKREADKLFDALESKK